MKKLVLSTMVLFVLTSYMFGQEINWLSMNEALELQKKNPKKIMIDVYTNWCGPCKMLDKNTFQHKDVAEYVNSHFYAVKFNAEGDSEITYKDRTFTNPNYDPAKANRRNASHEFSRYMQISAFPTIVFLDEEANYITPVRGYQAPQQLELYLKLFKTDAYKTMKSQEEFQAYYENFKPSFQK